MATNSKPKATEASATQKIRNHLYYGDNLEILRAHIKDEFDRPYLSRPAL